MCMKTINANILNICERPLDSNGSLLKRCVRNAREMWNMPIDSQDQSAGLSTCMYFRHLDHCVSNNRSYVIYIMCIPPWKEEEID